VNRKDLQALSRIRIREAKGLLSLGLHDGAYYLAGYAVECALKACIAKGTQRHDFPERKKVDASHTHDLRQLLTIANLEDAWREETRRSAAFRNNWDVVLSWSEQSRYSSRSPDLAREIIQAIENKNGGVIRWIRHYW